MKILDNVFYYNGKPKIVTAFPIHLLRSRAAFFSHELSIFNIWETTIAENWSTRTEYNETRKLHRQKGPTARKALKPFGKNESANGVCVWVFFIHSTASFSFISALDRVRALNLASYLGFDMLVCVLVFKRTDWLMALSCHNTKYCRVSNEL